MLPAPLSSIRQNTSLLREPLTLYDRNAPFSNEHWLLLDIIAQQHAV